METIDTINTMDTVDTVNPIDYPMEHTIYAIYRGYALENNEFQEENSM